MLQMIGRAGRPQFDTDAVASMRYPTVDGLPHIIAFFLVLLDLCVFSSKTESVLQHDTTRVQCKKPNDITIKRALLL